MAHKQPITRRQFLSQTSAASLGITAFPYLVPNTVFAKPGRPGANDRIVVGHIGVGGMGGHHLGESIGRKDVEIAAICDVDAQHLKAAADRAGGSPLLTKDYRRVLERKDIDAVFVTTPDHWHGVMTVHACQAGKDVYCEKPACNTIEEGRAMVEATKRYGRVVQIGSQGRSTHAAFKACQFIRNGQLGKVQDVTCWHYPNPVGGWKPDTDPPDHLDWNLWLGPARWVPYNVDRCHFNFRWFLEFGGGQIRDRGAHVMSVILFCLDKDNTGPVSVEATGEPPHDGIWDCPVTMDVTYEFKDPDWKLYWRQPGEPKGGAGFGAVYRGDKDSLVVTGGDGGCGTEDKAMQYEPPSTGVHPFRSPGHRENWLDCIRTREKPIMHIEAGVRVANLCIIGNVAYQLGRKLKWNPLTDRFIDDDEANRMLTRPGRGEFHV